MFTWFKFISNLTRLASVRYPKSITYSNSGRYFLLRNSRPISLQVNARKLIYPVLSSTLLGVVVLKPANTINMGDCKGVSSQVLADADKLFDESKFEELEELLKKQNGWEENEQVLWRLARCEFQLSKKDDKKKNELVTSAYEHVKKSLELDDKNGLAHKWAAILLDAVSTIKGTKERVLQVLNVKNHMEKAIEYAPTDATSYYLLGEWHFSCYQVSWWERKIASVAFGKLPDADMEEALRLFEKAEEIEQDFYSKNKLMLAKTLLELKRDKERAIKVLEEVVSKYSNSEKWDDKEVSCLVFHLGTFSYR